MSSSQKLTAYCFAKRFVHDDVDKTWTLQIFNVTETYLQEKWNSPLALEGIIRHAQIDILTIPLGVFVYNKHCALQYILFYKNL